MLYVFAIALVTLVIFGIVKAASGDRYENMTEEEFEAEAKRSSRLSGSLSEFQKIFDANHHVEYVKEQEERVEADGSESGDHPHTNPSSNPKS